MTEKGKQTGSPRVGGAEGGTAKGSTPTQVGAEGRGSTAAKEEGEDAEAAVGVADGGAEVAKAKTEEGTVASEA